MILTEQIHKNLYRAYFRGQRKDYDKSKANFDFTCFTTNPVYALYYAKKEDGAIKQYFLKEKINIFNARSKTDFNKLHKYVIDNTLFVDYSTLERLKDEDWVFVLGDDKERSYLIDIIKELGYDGFFNFEWTKSMKREIAEYGFDMPDSDNNPAICVFNANKCFYEVDVDDPLKLEAILDFKEDELERIKNNYYRLRRQLGEESAYSALLSTKDDWLTVSPNEVENIAESLIKFDTDKAKRTLKVLESCNRPGFKEAAAELRERINAQTK